MSRPLLIYDGDCSFCRRWVRRWETLTGPRVDYAPSQEVAPRFPEIHFEEFKASVKLIEPDGTVTSGSEAIFRLLRFVPGLRWMLWIYRKIPGAAFVAERGYRFIARHRGRF